MCLVQYRQTTSAAALLVRHSRKHDFEHHMCDIEVALVRTRLSKSAKVQVLARVMIPASDPDHTPCFAEKSSTAVNLYLGSRE